MTNFLRSSNILFFSNKLNEKSWTDYNSLSIFSNATMNSCKFIITENFIKYINLPQNNDIFVITGHDLTRNMHENVISNIVSGTFNGPLNAWNVANEGVRSAINFRGSCRWNDVGWSRSSFFILITKLGSVRF